MKEGVNYSNILKAANVQDDALSWPMAVVLKLGVANLLGSLKVKNGWPNFVIEFFCIL